MKSSNTPGKLWYTLPRVHNNYVHVYMIMIMYIGRYVAVCTLMLLAICILIAQQNCYFIQSQSNTFKWEHNFPCFDSCTYYSDQYVHTPVHASKFLSQAKLLFIQLITAHCVMSSKVRCMVITWWQELNGNYTAAVLACSNTRIKKIVDVKVPV